MAGRRRTGRHLLDTDPVMNCSGRAVLQGTPWTMLTRTGRQLFKWSISPPSSRTSTISRTLSGSRSSPELTTSQGRASSSAAPGPPRGVSRSSSTALCRNPPTPCWQMARSQGSRRESGLRSLSTALFPLTRPRPTSCSFPLRMGLDFTDPSSIRIRGASFSLVRGSRTRSPVVTSHFERLPRWRPSAGRGQERLRGTANVHRRSRQSDQRLDNSRGCRTALLCPETIDDDGSQTLELRKNPTRESGTWTWQEALADAESHSPAGTIADVQSAADEEQLRELFHEEFCEGQNNPRENVCLITNTSDSGSMPAMRSPKANGPDR